MQRVHYKFSQLIVTEIVIFLLNKMLLQCLKWQSININSNKRKQIIIKKQYLHIIQLYKLQKLPAGEHIRDINKWIGIDNCYFIFVINYWLLNNAEKVIRKIIRISSEAGTQTWFFFLFFLQYHSPDVGNAQHAWRAWNICCHIKLFVTLTVFFSSK